ncbi:MAG: hypothetical protein R3D26_11340 [Cyanobacteriota/Melainabacteria group bacterium]
MSNEDSREKAAKAALNDIRWLLQGEEEALDDDDEETYLDGPTIVRLLEENFERLDPNNNGIEREELMTALMNPQAFTTDEYEMLRLITKYFDTIINMSDDEEGEDQDIPGGSSCARAILVHSKMTLGSCIPGVR